MAPVHDLLKAVESLVDCESNVIQPIDNHVYVHTFAELSKFLQGFGMVFGFVTKDIDSKRDILIQHARNRKKHGSSLELLVQYEIDNGLTNKVNEKLKSYSRTLLRLHRAMEFVAVILKKLAHASPSDSAAKLCSTAYDDTLSKHHTWLIRNSVGIAFYTMGSCEKLLDVAFAKEAKQSKAIDRWASMRETTLSHFRWTTRSSLRAAIWGVAVPVSIYYLCVNEMNTIDSRSRKEPRKFLGN